MDSLSQDLKVVASLLEREGHVTYGVLHDGVFVPIAQHKLGHLSAFAQSDTTSAVTTDKKAAATADTTEAAASDAADASQSGASVPAPPDSETP